MIICKLCKLTKEPKSNSHYLSDFLIRTALNDEGANKRGRGIYWGIDSTKIVIDFKFQSDTPILKLERLLKRSTTDKENADARYNIDFAVSDSFCESCEKVFTKIEDEFAKKILSKFRQTNLIGINEIIIESDKAKLFRLFFLMQFWRTSVCTDSLKLPRNIQEYLRIKIFNSDYTDLESIPMSVYYLQTIKSDGDDESEMYKTSNVISIVDNNDPFQIIMNDFVIQLHDNKNFNFDTFFGLNNSADYIKYLNYNMETFQVKIIDNAGRLNFLRKYFTIAANKFFANLSLHFLKRYVDEFRKLPSNHEIHSYLNILASDKDVMTFTEERQEKFDIEYFKLLK